MSTDHFFRKEVLRAPAYKLDEHPGIKLNQNESPWDIPSPLKALVAENLMKTPWNRYPLNDMVALQKKMAKVLNLWPDNLLFANGSNVLIQALLIATSIDEKVMVVDPTFSVYEIEAELLGNKILRVELGDDFQIPEESILKTIKKEKPRLIFIPNPNAPTGNLFDTGTLRKIVEAAPGLVVIDEAYYPFSGITLVDWVKQHENLVILRTLSKAFALGGLRLGFMIADPEVCQQVQKCLLPFCVSKLNHVTALTILDHQEYVDDYVKKILEEREKLFVEMQKFAWLKVWPSQSNYFLFETARWQELFKYLLDRGIIVRQMNNGRRLKEALRVTVGSPEENKIFLEALKDFQ